MPNLGYCPLRPMVDLSGRNVMQPCIGDDCAWFVIETESCALLVIARSLQEQTFKK
jgi:hypothetical protein